MAMNNQDDSKALARLHDAILQVYDVHDEWDFDWLMEYIFCDPVECINILKVAAELAAEDTDVLEPSTNSALALSTTEFAAMYFRDESWASDLLLDGKLVADRPGLRISHGACEDFFRAFRCPTPEELNSAILAEPLPAAPPIELDDSICPFCVGDYAGTETDPETDEDPPKRDTNEKEQPCD